MITCGDCLDVMATMEPNSVDAIVTDPPYGLEFMGKEWDRLSGQPGYVERGRITYRPDALDKYSSQGRGVNSYQAGKPMQDWHYAWAVETLRVAKPGCHLLAFGGTRTWHRLACALEDAGWEIRDTITWVYGSGFPKSHNLKGDWQGWGTALKPAWEPIILARKPLEGTVMENIQRWGTGCINIDGCRIALEENSRLEKGGSYSGNRTGSNVRSLFNSGNKKIKYQNPPGRWPANLIHDGSEEVLELFPETKTNKGKGVGSRAGFTSCYGNGGQKQYDNLSGDSGSAARFFKSCPITEMDRRLVYCPKASRAEREMGCEGMPLIKRESQGADVVTSIDRKDGKGRVPVNAQLRPSANHHPTVKPLALMRYLCRLVTPPNGLILDPFMGSGTTGMAAQLEGFGFIGIEKEKEYVEIAERRIEAMA